MTVEFHRRSDTTTVPATRSDRRRARSSEDARHEALRAGTRLHEFELLGVVGCGGFGIVYLARDHTLLRHVAIKEYLPVDFARRTMHDTVVPRTAADASTFAMGLRSFLKEAQLLAGFDHPSLVKVHRFWEANGTAYMAMPYYAGRTLKEVRRSIAAPPDERWLREFLEPLLSALEVLHDADVCHRDLSPDNVMLLSQGRPVLLDFGSARQVLGDKTQALTAVFKPSFAAIEQYGDVPGLRQGPWTDLYALGGVVHFLITGTAPTPAAMRAVHDPQRPLLAAAAGTGLSPSLLRAIDWALAVRPERRPPSVRAFREVLHGQATPPDTPLPADALPCDLIIEATEAGVPCSEAGAAVRRPWSRRGLTGALAGLIVAVAIGATVGLARSGRASVGASSATAHERPSVAVLPPSSTTALGAVAGTAPATAEPMPAATPARSIEGAATGASSARAESGTPRAPLREKPQARAGQRRAVPTAPPSQAATSDAGSPRQACAERNFLFRAVCVERVCRNPTYHAHPECAAARQYAESRRARAEENR